MLVLPEPKLNADDMLALQNIKIPIEGEYRIYKNADVVLKENFISGVSNYSSHYDGKGGTVTGVKLSSYQIPSGARGREVKVKIVITDLLVDSTHYRIIIKKTNDQ
ncbi:hypothetical protein FLL45_22030 [Aliikangiella marina]|uniref:Uncharacterized protein n=1 Tax=Aliikangiella marina TaxID=1712262 RepID=A0A545T1D9_9GAMM|nr:hypothetical protein [Aliikangiella marina]TQV71009.1 hypothetical protein FLL45_22030 [Aliikangiella marina]